MKNRGSIIIHTVTRIVTYGLMMVIISQLMLWDAGQTGQEIKFLEATFTEWSQQIILMIMAAIFAYCAYRFSQMRCLSVLLAGISMAGLVREYNNFFKDQVFDGAWQLVVLLVVGITGILVWKLRKSFWDDLESYYHTLGFGFLLSGFLTTFIFSRLFGRTRFWETLMEEHYFRSVKNAAEECIELLGYGLLLVAAIEYFILARSISSTKESAKLES